MVTRSQRGNQNPYIEGQTIQWSQDTKGVIRIRISKDRQYNGHKIPKGGNQNPYIEGQTIQWSQDTKGVIRIRISKDRQYNGHKIPKG